ncbi:carbohydrate sulfotransferase 14, partial [Eurytemora carolleeae]|uniref:carbohydrate sulfotransferase 14 n=1 Tax=Eurytemora carolleeae TaxID=1294199 RepID=UPI000C77E6D1
MRFNQKASLGSYLIEKKRKVLYCWNHKVASSSWFSVFSKYSREKFTSDKLYKLTGVMSPKSLEEFQIAVQEYKNIILIRHPIQRLISAYRDRVQGLKLSVPLFRKISQTLRIDEKNSRKIMTIRKMISGKPVLQNRTVEVYMPTWTEFIHYIILTPYQHMDFHWTLFTHHCSPCVSNFSIILQADELEDQSRVLKSTNLTQGEDDIVPHLNPSGSNSSSNQQIIRDFMSQVSCK